MSCPACRRDDDRERDRPSTGPAATQFGSGAGSPDSRPGRLQVRNRDRVSRSARSIQPDGQSVVFHFNYMYTTNMREPVRADEKHLGRVKRHFIDTDVQLRQLRAARSQPLPGGPEGLADIAGRAAVGGHSRGRRIVPSAAQRRVVAAREHHHGSDHGVSHAVRFDGPALGPGVAELDPLRLENDEFVVRNRRRALLNRVFDHSSNQVDEFLRIPEAERRADLYRSQETIPAEHPNGYIGPGLNQRDSCAARGLRAQPATIAVHSRRGPRGQPE